MRCHALLVLSTLLATAVGCTSKGSGAPPATPDALIKATQMAVDTGQPEVVWASLPASYQNDVSEIVHEFGSKMDGEVYDRAFVIANKLVRVMDEKRDFILSEQGLLASQMPIADVKKDWDAAVQFLSTIVNSDLKSLDNLKTLNVESFLSTTGGEVMKHALAASRATGQGNLEQITGTKTTVIEETGDTARVRVEMPGAPVEEDMFVKVEGRWIPKEMADDWPGMMANAKATVAGMQLTDQDKAQFGMIAGMLEGTLDQLLAAESEQQFNASLQGVMGMLGPMMMRAAAPGGDVPVGAEPTKEPADGGW